MLTRAHVVSTASPVYEAVMKPEGEVSLMEAGTRIWKLPLPLVLGVSLLLRLCCVKRCGGSLLFSVWKHHLTIKKAYGQWVEAFVTHTSYITWFVALCICYTFTARTKASQICLVGEFSPSLLQKIAKEGKLPYCENSSYGLPGCSPEPLTRIEHWSMRNVC